MAELMDSMAARLHRLSQRDRASVARLVDEIRKRGTYSIERRKEADAPAPASFAQERLWFVDALRPGHGAYNITTALEFDGPLNVRALAGAIESIVERHETLRTTFVYQNDGLFQIVSPATAIPLPVIDLSDLDAGVCLEEIDYITTRELEVGFDLVNGPMLRAVLMRLSTRRHRLLLTTHHIASDGWSAAILHSEIRSAYAAHSRGAEPSLPSLVVQYSDYSAWQRDRFRMGDWQPMIEFWRAKLLDAPATLDLPMWRARPTFRDLDGKWLHVELPMRLVVDLENLARREGCTIFMTLLAAYAALLQRYCGSNDLIIGVPVANRGSVEVEPLIGFFVNAVPMRIRSDGSKSFRELLQEVRDMALQAFQHQELPFEKMVEEVDPARGLSHNPVFQATFALQNQPPLGATGEEGMDPGLQADRTRGSIKFDLSLHLRQVGSRILGSLGYATDILKDEAADILAEHYVRLLTEASGDPDLTIQELVPAAEPLALKSKFTPERGPASRELSLRGQGLAALEAGGPIGWNQVEQFALEIDRALAQFGPSENSAITLAGSKWSDWIAGAVSAFRAGATIHPECTGKSGAPIRGLAIVDGRVVDSQKLEFEPSNSSVEHTPGEVAGRLQPSTILPMLQSLAARLPLSEGALLVTGGLDPVDSTLAALLAVVAAFGLTSPPVATDPSAVLDCATWEGADGVIVNAEQAQQIAQSTFLPLDTIYLIVVGGPLGSDSARKILDRGGSGIVLSGDRPDSSWLFAADLADVAEEAGLGLPLIDIVVHIVGQDGRPAPYGAYGKVVGRLPFESDFKTVYASPAMQTKDGTLVVQNADVAVTVQAEANSKAIPGGLVETALAGIFHDVLGQPLAPDEDFFSAGGHSLRAAQVVARIKDLLRQTVPLHKLFEERTINRLAAHLKLSDTGGQLESSADLLLKVAALSEHEARARLANLSDGAA